MKDETEDSDAHMNGVNGDGEAPKKKKKKAHRGYAFVVYEREKDMKGTILPITKFHRAVKVCISG